MRVGIAGGGLVGRLLAWRLAAAGASVEVFDAGDKRRCAAAGAGMLGPWVELADASRKILARGLRSIELWRSWLGELGAAELLVQKGSLLLAQPRDQAELERRVAAIRAKAPEAEAAEIVRLKARELHELEPALARFDGGYFFPNEANVMVDAVLERTGGAALAAGVAWNGDAEVEAVGPGLLRVADSDYRFDWACDCRGIGADATELRAVRGETVHLASAEVTIGRPLHFAHPRQPLYMTPCDGRLILGATMIESSDPGPITVRSALELLGAAYAYIPELAEAAIVDTRCGLRPALADNEPRLDVGNGRLAINGMYRHGYLTSPAIVAEAVEAICPR